MGMGWASRERTLVLGPVLAGLVYFFLDLGWEPRAQLVLAITVLAVVYWFTEALPLHITGLLIAFLLILLGGFSPGEIFPLYFDPIVVLLLGGFVLAIALQKHGLDHLIAHRVLSHLGEKPSMVLLGFMFLTAFLSLWMSNTASAALMIPIVLFVLHQNKLPLSTSSFAKAFILGVAYAATVGGLGTLVGSTPNPLAAKYLGEMGMAFGFWDWMFYGLPFVLIFLFVIWGVVLRIYPPEIKRLRLRPHIEKLNKGQRLVIGIFLLTALLWATDSLTKLSTSVVALVPILLLYLFRLLETEDFKKVDWPILSLIGSGIVLGSAFQATGIDAHLAALISAHAVGLPIFLLIFLLAVVGIIVTMFASNTASAALMIPLTIPLAPALGIPVEVIVVVTAIAASIDFTAPMGTPPNAIAYSTGAVTVPQMAKTGLLLSLLAALLLSAFATFVWM
ncbi:MAG: DASS family sodium-coupled anion symporter [Candidatus Diapherotrites archaeon]|nr:DASS family sodium-coupled anion symporter [Candidatus Diapherotrites archaeon]MDZ4256848.1 DASS family sodium-coupled anion symporter [archaeon]